MPRLGTAIEMRVNRPQRNKTVKRLLMNRKKHAQSSVIRRPESEYQVKSKFFLPISYLESSEIKSVMDYGVSKYASQAAVASEN